ncbi:PTS system, ascorbate-specific EIIC component [Lactiplantibacillus plantarum subsp. plantarum]|nr:PTS system, ascorbate-specific EIIC component [Lactiplantibacillus plantarum subsp. plantarum]
MKTVLNLFVGIVTQPSILVALIAMLGLLLQKRKVRKLFKELLRPLPVS